jgi:hypothetical protein
LYEAVKEGLEADGIIFMKESDSFKDVMNLTISDLRELESYEVSEYIYTLSQYILYLTQVRNFYRIEYKRLSDEFDKKITEIKGSTKKDKKTKALEIEENSKIYDKINFLEAHCSMFTGFIEGHLEILNALKKIREDKVLEIRGTV